MSEADKHLALTARRAGAEQHSVKLVVRPLTGRPLGAASVLFERKAMEGDFHARS